MDLQLMFDLELHVISNQMVRRRIKRELIELDKLKICKTSEVVIKTSNNRLYDILFTNLIDNKKYKFVISHNHPFSTPKLFINNKPYMMGHMNLSPQYRNQLKKYTGIECFCCESMLCENNWCPLRTFKHILNQIDHFRNLAHQITLRIFVAVITRKYLIDDINLTEWLF